MTRYGSADGLSGLSPEPPSPDDVACAVLSSHTPEEEPVLGRRCVFAGFFQQMAWAGAGGRSTSVGSMSPLSSQEASPSWRLSTSDRNKAEDGKGRPSCLLLLRVRDSSCEPGSSALGSLAGRGLRASQGARGGGWFLFLSWALIPGEDLISFSNSTVLQPSTLLLQSAQGFSGAGTVLLLLKVSCCRPGRELAPAASLTPSGCPP